MCIITLIIHFHINTLLIDLIMLKVIRVQDALPVHKRLEEILKWWSLRNDYYWTFFLVPRSFNWQNNNHPRIPQSTLDSQWIVSDLIHFNSNIDVQYTVILSWRLVNWKSPVHSITVVLVALWAVYCLLNC